MAYSPDGKKIAAGYHDSVIIIWNANDGAFLRIFVGHSG